MLVQPTISHFVKNHSKSQPLLKPKQEITDVVNSDFSLTREDNHAATTFENKLAGSSNSSFTHKNVVVENQTPSSNTTANEEGLPLNQVKPQRGGHKLLSLKDRKRKHRTYESISPQSAESCSKKVCFGAFKSENVHPNITAHQHLNGDILRHSEKMEDCEKVKIADARKLSCEFTMEEEALMCGYALDSKQSNTKKLSLADLDINAKLLTSSVNSPIRNQTSSSKDHLLTKINGSAHSIPCSPSFSPRRTTPKAFSPIFERTRLSSQSGSGEKEDHLVNGHVRASGSIENLDSSAILFSTPATAETSQRAVFSHSTSKSVPRRTLNFGPSDEQEHVRVHPAGPVQQVNETILPSTTAHLSSTTSLPPAENHQSAASDNDFSFMSDISLSEFADVSRVEMEAEASSRKPSKKFDLNRHLVLEVTSQECSSEDAVLCTGRYMHTDQ